MILSIEDIPSVIGIQSCNGTVRSDALKGLLERNAFALGSVTTARRWAIFVGYGKKVTQMKVDQVDKSWMPPCPG